jgi:hypothetical protein
MGCQVKQASQNPEDSFPRPLFRPVNPVHPVCLIPESEHFGGAAPLDARLARDIIWA